MAEATEYVEVSIEEFREGHQIPFDIFIRLSDKKYVRLASEGDDLSPERLAKYKERKITSLYLRREDFLKYVGLQQAKTPETPDQAVERELGELCHLGDLTLELIFFNEMNEITFGTAKNFVDTTIGLLTDDRHAMGLLGPLNGESNFVYAHGVAVSAYCVMIAREMGWTNTANIFKLATGGLLHDIGKREFPKELLMKPKDKLKATEVALLAEHPVRGVRILENVPSVPTDILEIVLQHHENILGTGYPNGLSRLRIHPMARIVAVANGFCNLVLSGPDGPGLKPQEAIPRLVKSNEFDAESLGALKKLFKI